MLIPQVQRHHIMNGSMIHIQHEWLNNDLLEAVPFPSFILGSDGFITQVNDLNHRLFGRRLLDFHFTLVFHTSDIIEVFEESLKTNRRQTVRWHTNQADAKSVYDILISPIDSSSFLVTLIDVTQNVLAKQLRRDFVGNVSHELKTPLTSILGFLETIQGAARHIPEDRDRLIGIMVDEANRMNRLVNDLLSLNQVETMEISPPTDTVDLVGIVQQVLKNFVPVFDKNNITISFLTDLKFANLLGDRDQLLQVVSNLVENAVKYAGPDKPITLSLSMSPYQSLLDSKALVMDVCDQGPGISQVHIPRITERFYRVDSHRSRAVGGTGLGLSIVKHIINRHKGKLRIKSNEGQGSTFSVVLPIQ